MNTFWNVGFWLFFSKKCDPLISKKMVPGQNIPQNEETWRKQIPKKNKKSQNFSTRSFRSFGRAIYSETPLQGYIQCIYKVYTGYIQDIYRVYTGYIQGLYCVYTGYIQCIHMVYTRTVYDCVMILWWVWDVFGMCWWCFWDDFEVILIILGIRYTLNPLFNV